MGKISKFKESKLVIEIDDSSQQKEYQIQRIVSHKYQGVRGANIDHIISPSSRSQIECQKDLYFLIKWKGYKKKDWEPAYNLKNAPLILKKYKDKLRKAKMKRKRKNKNKYKASTQKRILRKHSRLLKQLGNRGNQIKNNVKNKKREKHHTKSIYKTGFKYDLIFNAPDANLKFDQDQEMSEQLEKGTKGNRTRRNSLKQIDSQSSKVSVLDLEKEEDKFNQSIQNQNADKNHIQVEFLNSGLNDDNCLPQDYCRMYDNTQYLFHQIDSSLSYHNQQEQPKLPNPTIQQKFKLPENQIKQKSPELLITEAPKVNIQPQAQKRPNSPNDKDEQIMRKIIVSQNGLKYTNYLRHQEQQSKNMIQISSDSEEQKNFKIGNNLMQKSLKQRINAEIEQLNRQEDCFIDQIILQNPLSSEKIVQNILSEEKILITKQIENKTISTQKQIVECCRCSSIFRQQKCRLMAFRTIINQQNWSFDQLYLEQQLINMLSFFNPHHIKSAESQYTYPPKLIDISGRKLLCQLILKNILRNINWQFLFRVYKILKIVKIEQIWFSVLNVKQKQGLKDVEDHEGNFVFVLADEILKQNRSYLKQYLLDT